MYFYHYVENGIDCVASSLQSLPLNNVDQLINNAGVSKKLLKSESLKGDESD